MDPVQRKSARIRAGMALALHLMEETNDKDIQEGLEDFERQNMDDGYRVCCFCDGIVHEDCIESNGVGLYACRQCASVSPLFQDQGYYFEDEVPYDDYVKEVRPLNEDR